MNPQLETTFQKVYFERNRRPLARAMLLAALCWILLAVVDITSARFDQDTLELWILLLVRAVAILSGVVFVVTLESEWAKQNRYMGLITVVTLLTFGISQIMAGIIDGQVLAASYAPMLILIPSLSGTLFRQRFQTTFVFAWGLWLIFIILSLSSSAFQGRNQ